METVKAMDKDSVNRVSGTPNSAWRGLYTAGGVKLCRLGSSC